MTHDSPLGGILKRGAAMAGVGLLIVQVVGVAQTLVLGRLLGPTEVGVFAAGTVLMGFIAVFSQGALAQALIQRKTDIEDAANTALVVTFCTGLLMGLTVLGAAPLIGRIFHSNHVSMIAAASSGMVVLHACTAVPDALMQRNLKFHRRLIIDPTVTVTFAVVAIAFALLHFGAWAMVIGTYASQLVWVALSWKLAGWRPHPSRFSFRIWREMATFSAPVLVDSVAERIRETAEQVIVGRFLGAAMLGQFRYGMRLGSLPSTAISQVCSYLLFPAFSHIPANTPRFESAYLRAFGWIWAAALPAGLIMILTAEPITVALLGEQWRPAGAAAAALAGICPGMALCAVPAEAIKGVGRPQLLTKLALITLGVGVPLALLLAPHGLSAVGIGISATHLLIGIVTVILAGPVVGVRLSEVLRTLAASTTAAGIAFAFAFGTRLLPQSPIGMTGVLTQGGTFVIFYFAGLRLLDPHRFSALVRAVRNVSGRLKVGRN